MREKVELLLDKYYRGETSPEEELELRDLIHKAPGFEGEKLFFLGLKKLQAMEPIPKAAPRGRFNIGLWQKIAATLAIFLGLGWLIIDRQTKKEEALAYHQVMEAFSLIQENIIKGKESLEAMEDFRYLNTTNELFNINKKEEK